MVDSTVPGAKNLDRPKSAILMADLSVLSTISMFSSFRSRCTMPAATVCSDLHTLTAYTGGQSDEQVWAQPRLAVTASQGDMCNGPV